MADKKYFYTDSLAAAWQINRHNMAVIDANGAVYSGELGHLRLMEDFLSSKNKLPFFIHPDSLHLLGPKEGDVGACEALYFTIAEVRTGSGFESNNKLLDDRGNYYPLCKTKITQRNSTAFMWPEVE